MVEATASRRRGIWAALGTPSAVRVVTVLMLVYAVIIGALVFGYAKVQGCVTEYSNDAARSTKARADAAAEDRQLNALDSALEDSDRLAIRNNDAALTAVVQAMTDRSESRTATAFAKLLAQQKASEKILAGNEVKRQEIRSQRREIEAKRAAAPPPAPPSETC